MPVPVWDCSDLLDEPQNTATVVSDDVWKKFDDDLPPDQVMMDAYSETYYERNFDDGMLPDLVYDKMSCLESREIRHHDCMWAGLCISKEHNRTLPAKSNSQIQKKVPAGRSLLIARAGTAQMGASLSAHQQQGQQHCRAKNLESDGDSTRPETPQSSSSDTETEDEGPFFRHDQINIHEKLSECMSEAVTKAVPVSEVTGQLVRFHDRRKEEDENQCQVHRETNIRNTLSDHCYHLNQPISKNLEHLGVQTPSDSEEEEIDVVTFEKPCRPAALPTYPSLADQQHFQLTVNTAFKEKRPRGRPPSNPAKKRAAQQLEQQKPAKRARQRATTTPAAAATTTTAITTAATTTTTTTTTRRGRGARCAATTSPPATKVTVAAASRSSSEDELDTEKRSLHNNMERQRRIELRNAFEELRMLVPAVEAKEKAPKVAILRQAATYCVMLTERDQVTVDKVTALKRRQERLRAELSHLRRSLAMTR